MKRCFETEIMEDPDLPQHVTDRIHKDLTLTHKWLGNTRAIVKALEEDPLPIRRVLDIGCGRGGLLMEVRKRLRVDVIGVDLSTTDATQVPIIRADAVRDALPECDVAFSVAVAHHLSDEDLTALIRNVGRYCRRFILLDLVRHRLPLVLFRLAVAPFVYSVNARDGVRSICRSHTPAELRALVEHALDGSPARVRHTVAPLYMRQIADISYCDES